MVKNTSASSGDIKDMGSIPGSGRSAEGGYGNSLQYSCLENPMDRGVCWAMVHRVTNSWTQLKQVSVHRINSRKTTPRQIIFKWQKVRDKGKILGESQGRRGSTLPVEEQR